MAPEEVKKWFADFESRFPTLGRQLGRLPVHIQSEWADEILIDFSLDDGLKANYQLATELKPFPNGIDSVRGVVLRRMMQIRHKRVDAERRAEEQRLARQQQPLRSQRGKSADLTAGFDGSMKQSFLELCQLRHAYMDAHQTDHVPEHEWFKIKSEYWKKSDLV